jgi:hypothetical protein
LVELEREDPQAAQALRKPPAVPVENVPPSLTSQQQEELRNCPTPESRKERAHRFIKDPDAADVIAVLAGWRPTRRRAGVELTEREYEEKLIRFLQRREHGFNGAIERRPPAQWGRDDVVDAETRKAIPDLAIRDRVLVELKGELKRSGDADRAMGQMLRYLLAWRLRGPAILVICGEVDPSIKFLVRRYIDSWRQTLRLAVTVFFVREDMAADASVEYSEGELEQG